MDIISENDERIIAEMKKEAGLSEDADVTYTEDDMEAFRERVRGIVEGEIKKEEEELSKVVSDEDIKKQRIREIYSKCFLSDCIAHTITRKGDILHHFTMNEVKKLRSEQIFAVSLIQNKEFDNAELRENCIVHRNMNGDVIKIYKLDEI